MDKILEATKYLEKGIATIPIKPHSKVAAIPWKKYQNYLPTREDIIKWFNGNYNMAIVCGNGLTVLDFDDLKIYKEWRLRHREISTYQVQTRRGYHLYFKVKNPVRTKIKAIKGVDIKANGGYVLVPPSVVKHCEYKVINGIKVVQTSYYEYEAVNNNEIMQIGELDEIIKCTETLGTHIKQKVSSKGAIHAIRVPKVRCRLYHGIIADIKSNLSVLDLANQYNANMKQSGNDAYIGRCPHYSHPDKNPSFRVVNDRANCFKPSCILHDDRAMDVIELYSRLHGLNNRDAISTLAKELGLIQ